MARNNNSSEITLHPKLSLIPLNLPRGPFVSLASGAVLAVEGRDTLVSRDDGRTWKRARLFNANQPYSALQEYVLLRTRTGTLILGFMNGCERQWSWNEQLKEPGPEVRLPTYVTRSTDDGRTWEPPQMLHPDWTGALRDIIQTRDGSIVFTSMKILRHPGRHGALTYRSTDDGVTWSASNLLDIGGHGHHDGTLEPALTQLSDSRLWMLIRTTLDVFYESFSSDGGSTWTDPTPTRIDASTAPGTLRTLRDGRLALVWNRLQYEGRRDHPRRGGDGQWSAVPAVNQRKQLSIAFSIDDGQSWSGPAVVASVQSLEVSYPFLYEHPTGKLWLTTMRGPLRASLDPRDFI